jgi:hypothetical protein
MVFLVGLQENGRWRAVPMGSGVLNRDAVGYGRTAEEARERARAEAVSQTSAPPPRK